jgi:hypothetical protein
MPDMLTVSTASSQALLDEAFSDLPDPLWLLLPLLGHGDWLAEIDLNL